MGDLENGQTARFSEGHSQMPCAGSVLCRYARGTGLPPAMAGCLKEVGHPAHRGMALCNATNVAAHAHLVCVDCGTQGMWSGLPTNYGRRLPMKKRLADSDP